MKKGDIIFAGIIIVLAIVIFWALFIRNTGFDEETAKCVAAKSKLFSSKTCSHCVEQKRIIGRYIGYFDVVDITENPWVWDEYNLRGVPTWIINGEQYEGIQSAEKLKELTDC